MVYYYYEIKIEQDQTDKSATGEDRYLAIRGREQMLIDSKRGVSNPGVGNSINAANPLNPNKELYMEMAYRYFCDVING